MDLSLRLVLLFPNCLSSAQGRPGIARDIQNINFHFQHYKNDNKVGTIYKAEM